MSIGQGIIHHKVSYTASFRRRANHGARIDQRRLLNDRLAKSSERAASDELQRRDIRRHLVRDLVSNLHRDERVHAVRRQRLLEINVLPRRHGDADNFPDQSILDDSLDLG